jgi:hypothetical protein
MKLGDSLVTCWLGDRTFGIQRDFGRGWLAGEIVNGEDTMSRSISSYHLRRRDAEESARWWCRHEGEKTGVEPEVECPDCDPDAPGWRGGDDCQGCGGSNRVPMADVVFPERSR